MKVIGIDLRALQTGHKYRGIGEVAKQVTSRILKLASSDHSISFIFYAYENASDPLDLLTIPDGLKFEMSYLGNMPEADTAATKKDKVIRNIDQLYGNPIHNAAKSDVFLQFDYAFGVPHDTKTILIKHDLIPYLFWSKYFESAWVPFRNKAMRTTLRTLFANYKYNKILRRSLRSAHSIISVSDSTKNDLIKYFDVPGSKIKVAHLGVSVKNTKTSGASASDNMPKKPYILFIGAGDARRRVEDLVDAFNTLKANGHDIQLVLVGENFAAPGSIPNTTVRKSVLTSSYKSDIITLGYISDEVKQRLYQNAIAFVYPTKYEGFGIPVLEAMLQKCPVITYKNSSIPEVAGDYALYAGNWSDIVTQVVKLIDMDQSDLRKHVDSAFNHSQSFTWDRTTEIVYAEIKEVIEPSA